MITAVALWLIIGGSAVAYVAWAGAAIAAGASPWPFVVGAPLAYAALLLSITTSWFALAWIFRAPRPPEKRIGCRASLRLFWDELRAIARSGPRMALYRWLMRDPPPAPAALPVLLLHGVLCNAGVFRGLRAHLVARGIGPVYAMSYGPPLASIELFAEQLAAKVDAILAETGAVRVALVAHSMGGVVARAYLRRHGGARIALLMTLGTPHHGSVHARLFPGACLAQIRPGSPWLAELNRGEPASAAPVVSLWSWHDSMLAPQTSARLAGARNIELAGVGHNAMLGDRRVFDIVAAEILRVARESVAGDERQPARDATNGSPA